jgi:hypothetical protein
MSAPTAKQCAAAANLLEGNSTNAALRGEELRQGHGRKTADVKAGETPERAAPGRQVEVC